jgi:Zn finger protein HypA/HybF involved in hydrogenase expression
MPKALTQEDFIMRAASVHGVGRYDYSQVAYRRSIDKIKIICHAHGAFEQEANSHLQGIGCPACGGRPIVKTDSFVTRARAIHGSLFDYSRVEYINMSAKVEILCAAHGPFFQIASQHLVGKGCQKCAITAPLSNQSFISRARAVHGEKYDYTFAEYVNTKIKVIIVCPIHGKFSQAPGDHMNSVGCPGCKNDKIKIQNQLAWIQQAKGKQATLYFIRLYREGESFFKIGITVTELKKRYCSKQSLGGYQYEVLAQHTSPDAIRIYDWEQSIIETFSHLKYKPNLPFIGATECFSSCDEILAIFPL